MHKLSAALVAGLIVFLGCGGGSATKSSGTQPSSSPTTSVPATTPQASGLSHSDLIARMDTLCAAGNARFKAINAEPIGESEKYRRSQRSSRPIA